MRVKSNALELTMDRNNQLAQEEKNKGKDISNFGGRRRKTKSDMKNMMGAPGTTLSMTSKAVTADPNEDKITLQELAEKGMMSFQNVSKNIMCVKRNNRHILSLFPDIDMAKTIIASSIVAPKNLTTTHLNYKYPTSFLTGAEAFRSSTTEIISRKMDEEYNLSMSLADIVEEMIAGSGSDPHLITSEVIVDDFINADLLAATSMERYKERVEPMLGIYQASMGYLEKPFEQKAPDEVVSMESFVDRLTKDHRVNVTDNANVLSFNRLREKMKSSLIRKASRTHGFSTESSEKLDYLQIFRNLSTNKDMKRIDQLTTNEKASRKSIGRPMVKRIPSEATIPIFASGNPDKHLGYFILLDETYTPISEDSSNSNFQRLNNTLHRDQANTNPTSDAYRELLNNSQGQCNVRDIFDLYKKTMGDQLLSTINKALVGEYVDIPNTDEMYWMLFTRALEARQTTVLFVPAQNLVYFSMFRNSYGVGKTLLEDIAVIASIRSTLLFAKFMAYIKNTIGITEVTIDLEEDDPDPDGTVEMVKNAILETFQDYLRVGELDPLQITDRLHRAGIKLNVQNHPEYPEFQVSYDKINIDHPIPDQEFDDEVKKLSLYGLGIKPEMIEEAFESDFAIGRIQNNAMFNRRNLIHQNAIAPDLTKFVSTIMYNDMDLRDELIDEARKNIGEITKELEESEKALLNEDEEAFYNYFVDRLAEHISVSLPALSDNEVSQADEELEDLVARIDNSLEHVISEDMFDEEIVGNVSEYVDSFRAAVKAMLIRRWAADTNYMPELYKLIGGDEDDDKLTSESIDTHLKSVVRLANRYILNVKDVREASNKDVKVNMADDEDDDY